MAKNEVLSVIINQILDRIVDISLSVHGTRAVQTLIERLANNVLEDQKYQKCKEIHS